MILAAISAGSPTRPTGGRRRRARTACSSTSRTRAWRCSSPASSPSRWAPGIGPHRPRALARDQPAGAARAVPTPRPALRRRRCARAPADPSDLAFVVPSIIVLVLLAIPPLLSGTYAGVDSVEPAARDAAHGMGMTGWQVLRKVEVTLRAAAASSAACAARPSRSSRPRPSRPPSASAVSAATSSTAGLARLRPDGLRGDPRRRPRARRRRLLALLEKRAVSPGISWAGHACCPFTRTKRPIPTPTQHSDGADRPDPDPRQAALVGSGSTGPVQRPPPRAPHPRGTEHDTHALPGRGPAPRRRRAARRLRAAAATRSPRPRAPEPARPADRPAPPARSRSARPTSPRAPCSARSTPGPSRPRASRSPRKLNIGSRETYIPALTGRLDRRPPRVHRRRCSTTSTRTPRSPTPDEVYTALQKVVPRDAHGARQVRGRGQGRPRRHARTRATSRSLKAIADLAAQPGQLTRRGPPELKTRQQGLLGLKKIYGLSSRSSARSTPGPADGRGAEERPGQGGRHVHHRPDDRRQRLRRARGPEEPVRLAQNVVPLVTRASNPTASRPPSTRSRPSSTRRRWPTWSSRSSSTRRMRRGGQDVARQRRPRLIRGIC